MKENNQQKTPFLDALKSYSKKEITPFDVPGHKMGIAENDFKTFIGDSLYKLDVNAPRGLDNINRPRGVIKEACQLLSEAYHCDHSFFLINGTSGGIIAMIMAACQARDLIIMPRNIHKSVVNGLILSGAIPVFIKPVLDEELEIANHASFEEYKKAIDDNPEAKAVFIINPTYFGVTTDIKRIVEYAHEKEMICLVDEAHGSHFHFCKNSPLSGMEAGADIVAASLHKTGGSLTQSSVLLLKSKLITYYDVQKALMILTSTSPSSILIASIDAARKFLYYHGEEAINHAIALAGYARAEINRIPGFHARGREHFLSLGATDYDDTKVVIEVDTVNLTGFDLYNLLFDQYEIQMELAETATILAIFSLGTTKEHVHKLIYALKEISKQYNIENLQYEKIHFNIDFPEAYTRPRSAYHAPKKRMMLSDAEGEISKETIMIYPPGIPLIIPGEMINKKLIDRIAFYESKDATILSDYDDGSVNVIDKENWAFSPKEED